MGKGYAGVGFVYEFYKANEHHAVRRSTPWRIRKAKFILGPIEEVSKMAKIQNHKLQQKRLGTLVSKAYLDDGG